MGLGIIEFVMEVEETFDVEISDSDAETIFTPRDLIDLLLARLASSPLRPPVCRSQRSFYRLRRALMDDAGVQRSAIRPQALWRDLLPRGSRLLVWRRMERALGLQPLSATTGDVPLFLFLLAISLTAGLIAFDFLGLGEDRWIIFWTFIVPVLLLTVAVTVSWSAILRFPAETTIGNTAVRLALPGRCEANVHHRTWTRDEIARIVRELIVEHFKVTEFTEDSRFWTDIPID